MSQTIVVKYGGHAMIDEELRRGFAADIAFLRDAGLRTVVVHGGGPQISAHLDRLGIESTFTEGLRVTTPEAMDAVRMVLVGQVNPDVVGMVNRHGPFAVGLSGVDASLFLARRKAAVVNGVEVDIGQVGEIVGVDPGVVHSLLDDGRIPVISSVANGTDGQVYNVNADTAAAALAVALRASKLIVLTDVEGLYLDWPDSNEVIGVLTVAELADLLPTLSAGMLPKMEACLRAVCGGVPRAHVLDGRVPHSLLEVFTDEGRIGTTVVSEREEAMNRTEKLRARWDAALMPNYGTPPVALGRGEGCTVWDVDGKSYLDLIGGIAVSALGHGHPALVEAISAQAARLAHTSNLFIHEPGVELAERLLGLLGHDGRVFFANSGTEANEAALKLVRRHAGSGRTYVVAAEGSFHGRTMGSLSLTGKAAIREPFGPFGTDVRFVPYGDSEALREVVGPECAGVFLEPAQGEGGVVPPPDGYLRAARRICDEAGASLVLDEVQSGIGRTGAWFAHQHEGVLPDVITLAKGLGGGVPIGACVALGRHGVAFMRGDHGSTFGGNPVACAAALAVIDTIERDGLLDQAVKLGHQLMAGVAAVDHPLIGDVRGRGLWRGIALSQAAAGAVEASAREAGFLVNAVRPDVIRLAPPLIIGAAEIQRFADALPAVLDRAALEWVA